MPEPCQNCGAELYAGQQFCRRCGAPVRAESPPPGEAPTRLFPEGAQTFAAAPAAGTSRLGGGHTDSVSRQQPTAYQPPLAAYQQTSPLPAAPPARRRRRGAWLAALLVVFVLGAGLASGAAYVWWRATRQHVVIRTNTGGVPPAPAAPAAPGVPGVPADLGDRIKEALKGAGVPLPLDESGAVVSGATTVLTRTYELGDDAAFAVHAVRGSVTVTGGDGEAVVVKITKHGGSAAERGGARVLESKTDEGVTLVTAPGPADAVSVSYEISVPRGLRRLEVAADRGDVRVSGFAGAVVSEVGTGEVEFRDVSGEVRSKLIKGSTRVFQGGAEREGSQQFSVVRGDIEATFADDANADLKAETLDGDIEVDAGFGLRVEKAPAGRRLAGRLGEGGEGLYFKVTNGDVRLKK
ncbi:MAG: hypothetical protein QOD42_1571 [Sphingomonadales bacterium]|jgi:hypothetical protein|nr:hypothetical protein [Sphingomonadales bacterium]